MATRTRPDSVMHSCPRCKRQKSSALGTARANCAACAFDLNDDCRVDGADLATLLGDWSSSLYRHSMPEQRLLVAPSRDIAAVRVDGGIGGAFGEFPLQRRIGDVFQLHRLVVYMIRSQVGMLDKIRFPQSVGSDE